ncbi:hypothetical protein M9H77_14666 [Catharanthus roseus]|uniref:Uncharacterized protein n=1 Tax=Catharanthus roseus TaxID=4058 RepID=A0ACC0BNR4_CATRO|nr:hypothetical protein M9H77_14666 [Catharanthus roseus]
MRIAAPSPNFQPPPSATTSPPPPPPPSPSKSHNMPILYYGLLVVGTAAIVLAIYNLIIIKWCADNRRRTERIPRSQRAAELASASASNQSSSENPNSNLICNFKYKKGGEVGGGKDEMNEFECAVCLSAFEEGEDVKQLPRCKHSFHTSCIDMWLYSHRDCPLCRSPVDPPVLERIPCGPVRPPAATTRSSSEGLLVFLL